MPNAAHHRQAEFRLNEIARRAFPPGVYHVDFADVAKLGGGDLERGEAILHRMFKMAGPRAIHPHALTELGGNVAGGRKVIQAFLDRLHSGTDKRPARYARGGAVGKVSKQSVNFRQAENNEFCARCRMYREPASCTAVAGIIARTDLCDLFQKA
jgi:hypothetical protein